MRLKWQYLAWLTPRPIADHRPLLELMRDQRAAPATWSDGSTDHTTRAFDCLADLAAMPLHDDGDEAA